MANIPLQRREGVSWWIWLAGIILLALIAYIILGATWTSSDNPGLITMIGLLS